MKIIKATSPTNTLFIVLAFAPPQRSTPTKQTDPTTLAFDVASVRQNKPGSPTAATNPESNVPLGPGNIYSPTGGLFTSRNFTALTYISFAYKLTDSQITSIKAMAPGWVERDTFDIQARTDKPNVTKDELRSMMRSLLRDRFGFVAHYESKQISIYALRQIKPGELGPKLQLHASDTSCPSTLPGKTAPSEPPPAETVTGGFPATCGGVILLPSGTAHRINIGARNIPLTLLANSLTSWGQLHYPVVDYTGLSGKIDFALEYMPEINQSDAPAAAADADLSGPTFREALKQQLGLKLDAQKGEVQVLVLDHIEPLSPN